LAWHRSASDFRLHCRPCEFALYVAAAAAIVLTDIVLELRLQALPRCTNRVAQGAARNAGGNDFVTANACAPGPGRHRDSFPLFTSWPKPPKNKLGGNSFLRAQIARFAADNIDSQLNLASAALRFGQIDLARKTLERSRAGPGPAAFHIVAAGWRALEGNLAEQEQQFDIAEIKTRRTIL